MKTINNPSNQKPIEIDASLKYQCPQCQTDHWLFLREAKTKNYKVVCECGCVFKPKTIKKLKLVYKKNKPQNNKLPIDTLNQCVKILGDLGFDKSQSIDLINKAYEQTTSLDVTILIKTAITLFGDIKNV